METVGIIAEYNPFHRGHARQFRFLRESGAKQIVVVMSGNWVQRGAPAWADKYLRCKMALAEGADLVLELPVLYALSSGEGFAFGGISMLDALSLESFCFGSECGEIKPLKQAAEFLVEETEEFQNRLKEKLRQGVSYPAARAEALSCFFPGLAPVLSSPNNILGIEYLKAVKRLGSSITPMTLQRNDQGYHGGELSREFPSSATAIRKTYALGGKLEDCQSALPDKVYALLGENFGHYPVEPDDFSSLVYYSLRRAVQNRELSRYGDISPELANRMEKALGQYENVTTFADKIKTKNITHSHITRSLFQVLLGVESHLLNQVHRPVPYLRLLGMRPGAGSLLRNVSQIPVIAKVADYEAVLSRVYSHDHLCFARKCFELDIFAADLYRQAVLEKTGVRLSDEYRAGIVKS